MSQIAMTFTPATHVSASDHRDGAVLFDVASGRLLGANLTGALIWAQLQGGFDTPEILDTICREFDVAREIAEPELLQFIAALRDHRLLMRGDQL